MLGWGNREVQLKLAEYYYDANHIRRCYVTPIDDSDNDELINHELIEDKDDYQTGKVDILPQIDVILRDSGIDNQQLRIALTRIKELLDSRGR